ncbi:MAG: type II secretion system protein [Candidatus Taylorbacteria bacterium]
MKKEFSIFTNKYSKGFTLVEMIVSLAIFSIVAVVALGALMKIIGANKKAQTLQSAMTNINFALESMSREMRVASKFACFNSENAGIQPSDTFSAGNCTSGLLSESNVPNPVTIAFKSSHIGDGNNGVKCNLIYAYSLSYDINKKRWNMKKATQGNCNSAINSNSYTSIIDDKVIITDWYVKMTNEKYPRMLIRLSGYVGDQEINKTFFDVQTAVASRLMTI